MYLQCSCYTSKSIGSRCKVESVFWLLQPDGRRNPGGYVCEGHGRSIVAEYQEKLGETWSLQKIDKLGNPV